MRLGPEFSRFGLKYISCRVRNQMLDNFFSDSHMLLLLFFYCFFFLQHLLRHYFIYVSAGFSKVLLALILGGSSKSHVFEKMCSVFSITAPVQNAGFI